MVIETDTTPPLSLEQKIPALHNLHSSQDLRNATRDFESLFIQKLLQVMQESIGKNDMFYSKQEGMWRSMLQEAYAKEFAQAGGIGLADMLYEYLAPTVLNEKQEQNTRNKAIEQYTQQAVQAHNLHTIL